MRLGLRLAIIAAGFLTVSAARPESPLDGKWEGTVAFTPSSPVDRNMQDRVPPPKESLIVIAKGGATVGIIGGLCVGRYEHVQRSGNNLNFKAADCKLSVSLSPDGKTLTETGTCMLVTGWMMSSNAVTGTWPVSWLPLRINGTFHRIK
jgi:hypothetical protein